MLPPLWKIRLNIDIGLQGDACDRDYQDAPHDRQAAASSDSEPSFLANNSLEFRQSESESLLLDSPSCPKPNPGELSWEIKCTGAASLWLNDRQTLHKLIEAVLQSRAAMQLGACLYIWKGDGVTPTVSNARSVMDLTGEHIISQEIMHDLSVFCHPEPNFNPVTCFVII